MFVYFLSRNNLWKIPWRSSRLTPHYGIGVIAQQHLSALTAGVRSSGTVSVERWSRAWSWAGGGFGFSCGGHLSYTFSRVHTHCTYRHFLPSSGTHMCSMTGPLYSTRCTRTLIGARTCTPISNSWPDFHIQIWFSSQRALLSDNLCLWNKAHTVLWLNLSSEISCCNDFSCIRLLDLISWLFWLMFFLCILSLLSDQMVDSCFERQTHFTHDQ